MGVGREQNQRAAAPHFHQELSTAYFHQSSAAVQEDLDDIMITRMV